MDSINNIVKKLREGRILSERKGYDKFSRDELIQMAQDGDQLAVEVLINSHKDFIDRMTKKYFMDDSYDREDIIQLGNIAFWDAIMKWDMEGNFEAYAGMIIKRRMIDEMNKMNAEKRQTNTSSDSLDTPVGRDGEGGETTIGDTLTSDSGSAEEEYLGKEGARRIIKWMENNLSDTERDVIRKYIEGYKVSEIAEETNMKYKSVENAIMRVKNKLAEWMKNPQKEAKKTAASEDLEFTEDEKKVLRSVLNKIDEKRKVR